VLEKVDGENSQTEEKDLRGIWSEQFRKAEQKTRATEAADTLQGWGWTLRVGQGIG
jgi:hypothetical protein